VWDAKRRADGIPAGWLVTLVERYGANPEWIKTGLGPRRLSLPLEDAPLDKLVAEMVRRAVNETESTRRRGGFVRPEQPC
jgi:hypothetical protein